MRAAFAAAMACLFLAAPAARAQEAERITITNSGSTNASGYTVEIAPDGWATYTVGREVEKKQLPPMVTQNLFTSLRNDLPFSQFLAAAPCAKSVSFGTVTTITYAGETSPDITCPGNHKTDALYEDFLAVQGVLEIRPVGRGF